MGLKDTRPGSQTGYVGGVKFSNNSPTSPPKFGVTQVVRQVVGVDSDVGDVFETGGLCVSRSSSRFCLVLRYRPSWEVVTDAALMPPPVPLTLLVLRFVVDICGERGWFKTTGQSALLLVPESGSRCLQKAWGGRWAELSTFCVERASMLFPSSF
ncbi:BnaA09g24580D [Brassica napus]|uniref:(rape) hypothetical protein n=1 Tax=Brassica napus TaxID=3708 RepID=A0A078FJH4_BRANA|nr:unnamed protein product [Brassica napus]CDY12258.1 BnaA09g24580D [Brassica napus]